MADSWSLPKPSVRRMLTSYKGGVSDTSGVRRTHDIDSSSATKHLASLPYRLAKLPAVSWRCLVSAATVLRRSVNSVQMSAATGSRLGQQPVRQLDTALEPRWR